MLRLSSASAVVKRAANSNACLFPSHSSARWFAKKISSSASPETEVAPDTSSARSRFFVDHPLQLGIHDLPEGPSHYISRVLRYGPGDEVQLFNGTGQEFCGKIMEVSKKSLRLSLTTSFSGLSESPLRIHLGQVLSKGERMDYAVQKATELGVAEITPLFSQRCEVRLNDDRILRRLDHWRSVVTSACEQCGRSVIPTIHPPVEHWVSRVSSDLKLVLHPHPEVAPLQSYPVPQTLSLLVGPEGGLTVDEITASIGFGFEPTRLGPRVLRTETAPVVALSVAQYLWGDLPSK